MSTVASCKNPSVTFACAPPGTKSWRRHWSGRRCIVRKFAHGVTRGGYDVAICRRVSRRRRKTRSGISYRQSRARRHLGDIGPARTCWPAADKQPPPSSSAARQHQHHSRKNRQHPVFITGTQLLTTKFQLTINVLVNYFITYDTIRYDTVD